jgi:hypothetical protein
MLCSLIFSRAAFAQNAPLSLMLAESTQAVPSNAEEPPPAPPEEPVEVDPSAPFVPSAKPSEGPSVQHAVGGALMTIGGVAGVVGLSCLLGSAGLTGTDEEGNSVPPPADPKFLQTVGAVALAAGFVTLIAGMSVYGSAH